MFGYVDTASAFLWGATGGLFAVFVASVLYVSVESVTGKPAMPGRFRTFSYWLTVVGSTFIGGVAAWLWGHDLGNLHQLSLQIGFGWPAVISAAVRLPPEPVPGTVS